MAFSSLQLTQSTMPNGIFKTKTNTFFTKMVFPSTQFTNKSLASNARAITKLTCVNGTTKIAMCNHIIGDENTKLAPLKIGIIGFGNFGQFIAKGMRRQGHSVLATSRSDYSEYCEQNGIQFVRYSIL